MATAPRGLLTNEFPPDYCYSCEKEVVGSDHYAKKTLRNSRFGYRWTCCEIVKAYHRAYYQRVASDAERSISRKTTDALRYQRDMERVKWRAYRAADKRKGLLEEFISWEDAEPIMLSPCYYCGRLEGVGLDRRDNTIGHSFGNVVACCFVCNSILCDIPMEAKDLIAPGLRKAREAGLLNDWIPPTLRRNKVSNVFV